MRKRHVVEEVSVENFCEQDLDSEHGSLKIGRTMVEKRERSLSCLDGVIPGKKRRVEQELELDLDLKLELGANHVSRLPEHILCFIFSLLHHPLFLYRCTLVCKLWNKLVTNEVDLIRGMWEKQEPWLLVRRSKAKYEMWCPVSGVRFPIPAKLIPEAISREDELGLLYLAGSHQGLTLIQSEQGLFVWAPLTGSTEFIPYPISPPPPAPHRCFASEFWADAAEEQQVVFKIGHQAPDGLHLYDSSTGGWLFEETTSEVLQLGRMPPVNSIELKESCPFPAPTSLLKQYASNWAQRLGVWKEWDRTPRAVAEWYALLRDAKGHCIGVNLVWETMSSLAAKIWRLKEDTGGWQCLGKKRVYSEVDLCLPKAHPEIRTACSENLLVFGMGGDGTPYPARILVFNLDTLKWDELYAEINGDDDSIHVMAIFKPTLPPITQKIKSS